MSAPRRSIGSALSGYALVTVVQAVVTFTMVGMFTRLLSASDYGRYTLAMATALFLQAVLFFWLHAGMVRFYEKCRENAETFAAHLATSWAAFSVAALVVAVVASAAEMWFGLLPFAAAAYLITRAALTLTLEQHRMAGEVGRYALLETSQAIMGLAAGVVLAYASHLDAEAPLFGMAFGNAFALLLDTRVILRAFRGRISLPHLRDLLVYGLPMGLAMLMHMVTQLFDRFIIAGLMDEAAAGVYAVAYAAADRPLTMVFSWLGMAASPLILAAYEREGREAAHAELYSLARMMLLIALPATVGLAMVAAPLAEVLAGPEFRGPVIELLPWIAAATLLNGLSAHYQAVPFVLQRRTGTLAATMAAAALLNTVLNFILIPWLGLFGAALSTVLAYVAGSIIRYVLARPWMDLRLPLDDTLRCGTATVAMAAALYVIPLPDTAAGLLPSIVIGGLVYAGVAWLLDAAGARSRVLAVAGRLRRRGGTA